MDWVQRRLLTVSADVQGEHGKRYRNRKGGLASWTNGGGSILTRV